MYSFQDALDAAAAAGSAGGDKTIDIEEQQRLFFSKISSSGASSSGRPLFSGGFLSRRQLDEGLIHAAPAHEDCLGLPHERDPGFSAGGSNEAVAVVPAPTLTTSDHSKTPTTRTTTEELPSTKVTEKKPLHLPAELHLQIITHYATPPPSTECGFCHLFALATACRVNRTWYHYAMKMLYSTISLDIASSEFTCAKHFHLSSKHLQMGKRIPLLVRTLEERKDLAGMVRRIRFPGSSNGRGRPEDRGRDREKVSPGGFAYWVTCGLEKMWVPRLLRSCERLEGVDGLEDVLSQLFNKEHYCFLEGGSCGSGGFDDDGEDEEHGFTAQALTEKQTLKSWTWGRGYLGKLSERVASSGSNGGQITTFPQLHAKWDQLERLGIIGTSGVTTEVVRETVAVLKRLKVLTLGLGGKRKELDEEGQAGYLGKMLGGAGGIGGVEKVVLVDRVGKLVLEEVLAWVDDCVAVKVERGEVAGEVFPWVKDTLVSRAPSLVGGAGGNAHKGKGKGKATRVAFTMAKEEFARTFWRELEGRAWAQNVRVLVRDLKVEDGEEEVVDVRIYF